ncbi:TonB-dependent receptor [Croceicoccus ponticola]|uniref:TonB-dependent receptor n=2 Tax=Croceicoccus ponticola TaxID=2217664 RepID=A0A437GZT6_9SPHN|nr:TonB-dependent receptor [Croceicoccus ponticola]
MRKYLFLLTTAFLVQPALAQDASSNDAVEYATAAPPPMGEVEGETITVVATGMPISTAETGQPVTIIGLDEIEAVQGPDLTRVLQRLPGTTVTRNGGVGGFTGVRVRGAPSEHLLVLIDGVKVNDAGAPGGGFDFGNLLAGNIQQIELLRGPNSVVWGSDAMGGVMNLTTLAPDGIVASGEYGSDETIYATLGGGMRTGALEAGVTGSYMTSDGYSTAAGGTEADGFRQWQVTGRARYELAYGLAVVANARHADGKLDQDSFAWTPPYAPVDSADFQDTKETSGRLGFDYAGKALSLRGGYSLAKTARVYTGESYGDYPYATDARNDRAELFGQYRVAGPFRLDFGADREWSRFADSGTTKKVNTNSGHALLGFYTPFATLAAGARYDDNSRFGDAWTFGGNASVRLAYDLRLRASYGEGFKAPTLYQLYGYYGALDLKPETSTGYDFGIEKGTRDGSFFAGVSLFRRNSTNLIDFDLFNSVYYNIGKSRAEGFEVELAARPSDELRAGVVYSYVESKDRTVGGFYEGNDLNRRPRHAVTASFDWTSPFGVALGADARLVGDSFDDRGEYVPLDGYETVDLRASVPLGPVQIYGRVENLFDAGYQTVAGYNTAGRSAHIGARLKI